MSITLTCACGTPVRPGAAGRRSVCPVCGMLLLLTEALEVPPSASTGAEGGYNLVPLHADPEPIPAPESPSPRSPRVRRVLSPCDAFFPEGFWRPLFWLAAVLAVVIAVLVRKGGEAAETFGLWPLAGWVAVALVVLGYLWGLFQCVLTAAVGGVAGARYWPGGDVQRLLRSIRDGLVSFFAGPAVFAGVAFLFWLESGDLEWADRLILAELCLAAVAGWLLAFTVVTLRGRLHDALPPGVVGLVWRLGRRGTAGALFGAAGILLHGFWALHVLEDPGGLLGACLLLFPCCLSLLFWTGVLLYWLGRCHVRQGARRAAGIAEGG